MKINKNKSEIEEYFGHIFSSFYTCKKMRLESQVVKIIKRSNVNLFLTYFDSNTARNMVRVKKIHPFFALQLPDGVFDGAIIRAEPNLCSYIQILIDGFLQKDGLETGVFHPLGKFHDY